MTMREQLAAKMKESQTSETHSLGYFKPNKAVEFYKPDKGKNVIDIIPFVQANGKPSYVQNVYVHKGIGADKKTVLCLHKMYKKPCPICEAVAILGENYKDNEDEYKALKAKQRVLYNVRKTTAPDEGIKVFEVSWYLFEKEMLKEATDPMENGVEIIIFSDLEEGQSVQFRANEETYGQAKYFKYSSFSFKDRKAIPEKIMKEAVSLDSCLVIPTYKEVQEIFLGISEEDYAEEAPKEKKVDEPFPDSKPAERKTKYETLEEVPPKENKCPSNHVYYTDVDSHAECANCDLWTDCTDNK